jgi:phosphate transport system protein
MTHLQDELNKLKESLTSMTYQIMSQLVKSMESLTKFDKDLAQEVIRNEKRVNALELKIDKECETIFTLMTPVAKDMRFVFATLKINNDLERVGDYAENNALMVSELTKPFDPAILDQLRLVEMTDIASSMLSNVIVAYTTENSQMARHVFTEDLTINEIHRNSKAIIAQYCKSDPDNIIDYLNLWSVARRLERIGDHLTNVAEEVIFYIEAEVLKHNEKRFPK